MELWTCTTDLAGAKQGPAVALYLSGYRREVALQVPQAEIKSDEGLSKVLSKFRAAFGTERNDQAFSASENFESLARVKTAQNLPYKYLGTEMNRSPSSGFSVRLRSYRKKLSEIMLLDHQLQNKDSLVTISSTPQDRGLIGKLLWIVANGTTKRLFCRYFIVKSV